MIRYGKTIQLPGNTDLSRIQLNHSSYLLCLFACGLDGSKKRVTPQSAMINFQKVMAKIREGREVLSLRSDVFTCSRTTISLAFHIHLLRVV